MKYQVVRKEGKGDFIVIVNGEEVGKFKKIEDAQAKVRELQGLAPKEVKEAE